MEDETVHEEPKMMINPAAVAAAAAAARHPVSSTSQLLSFNFTTVYKVSNEWT